jgi:hypothetical protein
MLGWFSNVDLNSLYDKAQNEDVSIEMWPEWITQEVKRLSEREDARPSSSHRNAKMFG